jgi:hypothetical protein
MPVSPAVRLSFMSESLTHRIQSGDVESVFLLFFEALGHRRNLLLCAHNKIGSDVLEYQYISQNLCSMEHLSETFKEGKLLLLTADRSETDS